MIEGALEFFKTAFLLFLVLEASLVFDEFFKARLESRKGFTGTKTTLLKILSRHALQFLRVEGSLGRNFSTSLRFLILAFAAGLLPGWGSTAPLECPHSIWVFWGLVLAAPALTMVVQWMIKKGAGWSLVLHSAERAFGCATIIFILGITLVAMTGVDTFAEIASLQRGGAWLIFRYPMAIPLMFAFVVVILFSSFQTVFSDLQRFDRANGWVFDDLLPHLNRSLGSIFVVDVFLGGATPLGPVGDILLVIKCVGLNVMAGVLSRLFFNLREDQAENFMLWGLAPVSIFILGLSLFFPGVGP